MGYFLLILLIFFIGGVVGIIEEIRPIIGPALAISGVIIGITLLSSIISNRKK